ncbi:hypothetical protein [Paracoccus sp. (in: a-proteobacteria)]|uniref:phosphorylase family protein n=1 Tax=Paracoccus sp. TaxID=267 RepID=UPI003A89EC5F
MKTAWYLGYSDRDIGEAAILVGDPDRVTRIGNLLSDATFLPERRGLRSVTGGFGGRRVTVAAFGMGAPIASIVMHELADLGIRRFLRIGTAMHFAPANPGDFLISRAAISHDGTAPAYADTSRPIPADPALIAGLEDAVRAEGAAPHTGTYATFDAFYRDMFALEDATRPRVDAVRARLRADGVLATDMETSALLAVAQSQGLSAATLCLGTVDGITQQKLDKTRLDAGEARMFRIALRAMTA